MARLYADVAATFLIHRANPRRAATAVAANGVRPVRCDILMPDRADRARLAADALEAVG